jgi:hypothetical protein
VSDRPSYEELVAENAALSAEIGKIDQWRNMVTELERIVRDQAGEIAELKRRAAEGHRVSADLEGMPVLRGGDHPGLGR